MFYGTTNQYYPGAQTPPLTETINQVSTPSFGGTTTPKYRSGSTGLPEGMAGHQAILNPDGSASLPGTPAPTPAAPITQPSYNLNDPGDFMRSLDWSNPQAATVALLQQANKNRWSDATVGAAMGFSAEDMARHYQKYIPKLGDDVLSKFQPGNSGWSPTMNGFTEGNTAYNVYRPGAGMGADSDPLSDIERIFQYDPTRQEIGDYSNYYNADGSFAGRTEFQKENWQQMLAMFLAAAGGMMMLPGGALSSTFGQGTLAAQNGLEAVTGGSGAVTGGGGAASTTSGAVSSPVTSGPIPQGTPLGPVAPAVSSVAPAVTGGGGVSQLLNNPVTKTLAGPVLNSVLNDGGSGNKVTNGSSNGGINLNNLAGVISAIYGADQQKDSAKDMIDWLNGQQAKIDKLYAPGSPEYNYLLEEMSRKDAAAGRNSQYGPRSVDLAARIAGIKADNTARLTTGIGNTYAAALRDRANSTAGIPAILGSILGGNGLGNFSVSGLLNSIFGNSMITDYLTNDMPEGLDMDPMEWWLQYGTGGD